MELSNLYSIFLQCGSVTTDSRNCPPGSLFIALKGDSFDGNAYAHQALEAGCAYAVVDNKAYIPENDSRYILVDNSLHILQQLARWHRRQLGTTVIGITGTNGKTTTKELIAAVLSQKYNLLYTSGNLNNHIGVPLTLLRLHPNHQLAVIEMGASHPGDIKELVEIAEPDYGIITNVGKAHLEGFGSFEGVKQTKGELFDYLRKEKPGATIFVHYDNRDLREMGHHLQTVSYGSIPQLYVSGEAFGQQATLSFRWKKKDENTQYTVHTQLIGDYNLPNALAALAIGTYFEVPAEAASSALSSYLPQNNRSQLKKTQRNTLIIDAYNANPTSMQVALTNFQRLDAPHKMVLLGDMRELGVESHSEHQHIIDYLEKTSFEKIWLVGEQFASTRHSFTSFKQVDEVKEALTRNPLQGYTILIKGSNGIRLYTLVDQL